MGPHKNCNYCQVIAPSRILTLNQLNSKLKHGQNMCFWGIDVLEAWRRDCPAKLRHTSQRTAHDSHWISMQLIMHLTTTSLNPMHPLLDLAFRPVWGGGFACQLLCVGTVAWRLRQTRRDKICHRYVRIELHTCSSLPLSFHFSDATPHLFGFYPASWELEEVSCSRNRRSRFQPFCTDHRWFSLPQQIHFFYPDKVNYLIVKIR